ncbi:MAG: SMC-Scp complex subunit ScpB [Phycisphaerales bacterium]|nr:SMC-Scp complex subunit ScpB [Phycisphaerales bacterium]
MDDARVQAAVLEDAPTRMFEHADHDPRGIEDDEIARLSAEFDRDDADDAPKPKRKRRSAKDDHDAPEAATTPTESDSVDLADAIEASDVNDDISETTLEPVAGVTPEPMADADDETAGRPRVAPGEVIDERNGLTFARVVEAMLFASDSSIAPARLADLIGVGTSADVKAAVAFLNEQYAEAGLSFRVTQIARGFQLHTEPEFGEYLMRLHHHRGESRLTEAAMETLSIIAYRQPITRGDIETIRGVAVGDGINRLRDAGLVKVVGRAEVVGRPQLFGTTRKFLQLFGLSDLKDLPPMETPVSTNAKPKPE